MMFDTNGFQNPKAKNITNWFKLTNLTNKLIGLSFNTTTRYAYVLFALKL